jgi:hypothetical protein
MGENEELLVSGTVEPVVRGGAEKAAAASESLENAAAFSSCHCAVSSHG